MDIYCRLILFKNKEAPQKTSRVLDNKIIHYKMLIDRL